MANKAFTPNSVSTLRHRSTHSPAANTGTVHITLNTPLSEIVISKNISLYEKLLGHTALDALAHFPTNIVKKIYCSSLTSENVGHYITTMVEPIAHFAPARKGGMYKIQCKVLPSGDLLDLIFFYKKVSTRFLTFAFAVGKPKPIAGKLEQNAGYYSITHPMTGNQALQKSQSNSKITNAHNIEVIYPQIAGITSSRIHNIITTILQNIKEPSEWHEDGHPYPSFIKAAEEIHSPTSLDVLQAQNSLAYQRLLHDELLAQQLAILLTRNQTKSLKGLVIHPCSALQTAIKFLLPFELTEGQKEALHRIEKDMASGKPMLRLIQGDVGCGKTIVAALAIANAIAKDQKGEGYQAAILAPTDILATQHMATLAPIFETHGYQVALLTGKITGKKRKKILEDLAEGAIHLLIGTHAVIQEHVHFKNLALVIVDEQHRFGVEQRTRLTNKGHAPHLLSMTATPIPRTLQMTLCGDLDVTSILEKPVGRKDILTSIHNVNKVQEIVAKLKKSLNSNHKAYWICPLIEESESLDYTAVKDRFAYLKKHFGGHVGLLHGKMTPKEKDVIMDAFKNGIVNILVATTVVEVGVDVKTANIIIIEHGECFGLAQLHQLRGRVGRSNTQARCLILYEKLPPVAKERLKAMRDSNDGFYLAEMDLKIRGSGTMLGIQQSGHQPFQFYKGEQPKLLQNLLTKAHNEAKTIIADDPTLISLRGQALQELLHIFRKENTLNILRSG
ncbi:MAG: ATP-dependent DNA helicase RecG [Alphaproteobacteria bacterium]|nr:ATP-dependent DNA helicase RecG [Alphaproteobacteria bacterium]